MINPENVVNSLPSLIAAAILGVSACVVARTRVRDSANRWFAIFLALVAANYALVAVANTLTPPGGPVRPAIAQLALNLAMMIQLVDPVALVMFAGVYPRANRFGSRTVLLAVGAAALVAQALFFLDPQAAVSRGTPTNTVIEVYVTTTYIAVFLGFLIREFRRPADEPAALPRAFLVGFGLLAFYRLVPALLDYRTGQVVSGWLGAAASPALQDLFRGAFSMSIYAAVVLAVLLIFRPIVPAARRQALRSTLLAVAILGAGVQAFLVLPSFINLVTFGGEHGEVGSLRHLFYAVVYHSRFAIRWIVFAALVAPAILANQVFDFDPKARRILIMGVVTATMVSLIVASTLLIEGTMGTQGGIPWHIFGILAVLVLAASQTVTLARHVANRIFPPARDADLAYRRLRRLEVYREASRAAHAGRLPFEDLTRMRTFLGLSEAEARLADTVAPASPKLRAGDVLAGRYTIQKSLADGAHGRVLLARDRETDDYAVIKEVESAGGASAAALIDREVAAARVLQDPRIVTASDWIVDGNRAFLISAYHPAGSLADRLTAGGPVAAPSAIRAARDIADCLSVVHEAGFVHRDVKPSNVLLTAEGRARLADFGASAAIDVDDTITDLLDPRLPGTPAYLPPEALRGGVPEKNWDVYAAGTVLFEMLTGRLPRNGEVIPPGAPPAVMEVVARARALDPGSRYPDGAALRVALEAIRFPEPEAGALRPAAAPRQARSDSP